MDFCSNVVELSASSCDMLEIYAAPNGESNAEAGYHLGREMKQSRQRAGDVSNTLISLLHESSGRSELS